MRRIVGCEIGTFGTNGSAFWHCQEKKDVIVSRINSETKMIEVRWHNNTYYLNTDNIISVSDKEYMVEW